MQAAVARLAISNLCKSFVAPVLDGVDFSLSAGEILGLVGENGAGKTTLLRILSGSLAANAGSIELEGETFNPRTPREALDSGIAYVTQELSTVDTLSVAENMFLSELPRLRGVIQREELRERAAKILEAVGLAHIKPDTPARALNVAEKQLLELGRALAGDCRVLLLDEPTSALSAHQADRVHEVVAAQAARGTAIVYVSHRLDDVLHHTDTVLVLRDGRPVAGGASRDFSSAELVHAMAGKGIDERARRSDGAPGNDAVLAVRQLRTAALPTPISLTLKRGEVLGIAGLADAGKSELLEAIFGLVPHVSGTVCRVDSNVEAPFDCSSSATKLGIGYVGEDRKESGIFSGQAVAANISMPGISKFAKGPGVLDLEHEISTTEEHAARFGVRCNSILQPIEQLSGGNQQKALLARWDCNDADILLLDEPTRGVDVANKQSIYAYLQQLQDAGKSIIVASSEIEELLLICDRIAVLSVREQVAEFVGREATESNILEAAFANFAQASTGAGRSDVQQQGVDLL